jgi:hypothetical protein
VGYDIEDTAEILIPFSGSVKLDVVVDNRAFARAYAFGERFSLAEAGFKVDGLSWNAQWWGGDDDRRRRSTVLESIGNPLFALRQQANPAARRRWQQRRRERLGAIQEYWPAESPAEAGEGRAKRSVVHERYRWANGIIPYSFSGVPGSLQSRVATAMAEYTSKTCIRFVPRSTETEYLQFRLGSECEASSNGRSGISYIDLTSSSDCDAANIMHKLGHVVGMTHEYVCCVVWA